MDKIPENIRKIRGSMGFSQKSFAKKLGISATHLNLVENGKKRPSLKLVYKISDKFDIDPALIVAHTDSLQILRDLINNNELAELVKLVRENRNLVKHMP